MGFALQDKKGNMMVIKRQSELQVLRNIENKIRRNKPLTNIEKEIYIGFAMENKLKLKKKVMKALGF